MKYIIENACITSFANTLLERPNSRIDTRTRKIRNRNDIIQALKDIYYHPNTLWAHARDGRGVHVQTNAEPFRTRVNTLLDEVGEKIYNYFNSQGNTANNQQEYDSFHEGLCDFFLEEINRIRADAGLANMSYGQAQKLINLTYKYLTTYSDYLDFADLFSYCHMVIDAIVLGTLNRSKIINIIGVRPVTKIRGLIGSSYNGKGWTAFSKKDYKDLVKDYRTMIDPYLGNNTYMHIEYHMWPTYTRISLTGTYSTSIAQFYK